MFSLLVPMAFALSCKHTDTAFNCVHYISNHDGDTITVEIKGVPPLLGHKITVRVLGIDTPEVNTKNACEKQKGHEAQEVVRNILMTAKRIDLVNVQRDKYFRILADVKADDQLIKDVLLSKHLAYPYDGGTKKKVNWCK